MYKIKEVIGALMLASLLVGLVGFCLALTDLKTVVFIFGVSAGLFAWIQVAFYLLGGDDE